jgi:hypothetical protein
MLRFQNRVDNMFDGITFTIATPGRIDALLLWNWAAYAQSPDSTSHIFATSEGAGTAILTFLGGFHPSDAESLVNGHCAPPLSHRDRLHSCRSCIEPILESVTAFKRF